MQLLDQLLIHESSHKSLVLCSTAAVIIQTQEALFVALIVIVYVKRFAFKN